MGVKKSRGIALVFVLIMMTIATSIALISARITLSDERSARNDRDRQIAFQSAEMALNDAELDIMDPLTGRGCKFGTASLIAGEGCSADADARGLCGPNPSLGNVPLYKEKISDKTIWDREPRAYVNYGEFTNRDGALQAGTVGAPSVAPKYIIVQTALPVLLPFNAGAQQYETTNAYRVYALGYGASKDTQVMLESVVVKPLLSSKCVLGGGLG